MIHLPFINKYPYTSMEAVNIDWLLNEVSKIPVLEEKVNQHEERITIAEGEIDELQATAADHETRITAAEADIDSLEGRMDGAEGEISGIKTRLTADESRITSLESEVSSQGADITSLTGRMTEAETDIAALEDITASHTNDIAGLDSRVTTLEGESAVIANPGGTGANLNTISIDDVTYVIPSGGGGGGGSSVTPNPAGTPTATMETIDVDGTIYDLPVSTTEVTQITNNITTLQDDVSDIQDNIDENINVVSLPSTGWSGGTQHEFEGMTDGTLQNIPDATITLTEPGTYLFILNASFDTRNFGSAARDLGLYLRSYISDPQIPDPYYNLGLAKAHINGNETAMITQAYNLNLMRPYVLSSDDIENGFNNFRASFRINSNSNKNVTVGCYCTCIKLNGYNPDAT